VLQRQKDKKISGIPIVTSERGISETPRQNSDLPALD
jgi:hypothetical protein